MKRAAALSLLMVALFVPASAWAQTTVQEARQAGKAMGTEMRADQSLIPSQAKADGVPGYAGTDLPQSAYFDDPDRLVAEGSAMAPTNDAFVTSTDRNHVRPTFSPTEILATTERATAIETNPDTYLSGEELSGGSGSCTPLPPGSGANGYYEATCNTGVKIEDKTMSCTIAMVPKVVNTERYFYYGAPANRTGMGFALVDYLYDKVSAGICRATGVSKHVCDAQIDLGAGGSDAEAYRKFCKKSTSGAATEFSCSVELPKSELASHENFATGTVYLKKEGEKSVTVERVESACAGLAGDSSCTQPPAEDVCVESAETRDIEGIPVTQACWAWRRDWMCHVETPANDCGDLVANPQCTYVRDECIDDQEDPDYDPSSCKVTNKVYRCPTPGGQLAGAQQFVCGNDVYCINGDCEPIEREASTEFKDALVALHSLDQAGKEFDEENFTVFSGERNTCHKPVFGLVDCCAGKVSGLLTVGAGAAALAGGPGAIAALATPFLTMFLCDSQEMMLDIKDRMGFCHKVGTYCSSSVLGICKTKRTAYCCFESKLSRILQEQGRPQLGKPWGRPKKEQCVGFTIDEFARLDLSVMDFTEVYAEFVDAAKLPDEIGTLNEIQTKIHDYYELHGGQ